MSESKDSDSTPQRSQATQSTAEKEELWSQSYTSSGPTSNAITNLNSSMVMQDDSAKEEPFTKEEEVKRTTEEHVPPDMEQSADQPATEDGSAKTPSDAEAGEESGADEEGDPTEGEAGSEGEEEPSELGTEAGPTSDLNSTPSPGFKDPGKMVSRALEYDLQDMYPEITLLFEDKQSAWNCQDPATIRAMWLESRTNILHDWKLRNGRIHYKEKPKLEVKPNMATTLRKQFLSDKAKAIDWREMYIPPGNDAPKYEALSLPTNKATEVRYNFIRNNPPVPSAYVMHYEKYRRPPFNVYQAGKCFPPPDPVQDNSM